jgi:hypothetical protein
VASQIQAMRSSSGVAQQQKIDGIMQSASFQPSSSRSGAALNDSRVPIFPDEELSGDLSNDDGQLLSSENFSDENCHIFVARVVQRNKAPSGWPPVRCMRLHG